MRFSGHFWFWFMIPLLSAGLAACCPGNYKCSGEDYEERYRILSSGGTDLLFGPGRVYDPAGIRFYSLKGRDTVFHESGAAPNPQPGRDSLLFVQYDYRKFDTVYLRLTATDTDTLRLRYETMEASPCCPDYLSVVTAAYNNALPEKGLYGEIFLKK